MEWRLATPAGMSVQLETLQERSDEAAQDTPRGKRPAKTEINIFIPSLTFIKNVPDRTLIILHKMCKKNQSNDFLFRKCLVDESHLMKIGKLKMKDC
ncbi:hypothetical protein MUB24_13185 [Lederbergia sp. NSJ-179]|uniref:hypothetical protein n=1 Tax=Lederbergia sp. NSJ-179 TaxID=2931402 RepID=UPI001FD1FD87|nr:hypothetical protein [Lederbergia sp. NSJ-179]MCJ7841835.1 hypothetical protein [Lederbergia sp. NSJ-179]